MNAPTPAQAAARRLQLAPLSRRTHEATPPKQLPTGAAYRPSTWKIGLMRALDGKMARRDICELLEVSHVTVRRHLGRKPSTGMTLSDGVSGKRGFPAVKLKPASQVKLIRSITAVLDSAPPDEDKALIERARNLLTKKGKFLKK